LRHLTRFVLHSRRKVEPTVLRSKTVACSILVVEDEPAIAESVAYALRRDGFLVSIAGTASEADELFARADLVVLDLMLPDGSGFDLIGKWRRARPLPIIVLSSRDGEADRVAALETGADDYVTKPFSPREIVARVRAVLRRSSLPQNGPSNDATELPIAVDSATRRAHVFGRPIDLTRVEFDLLASLLESPGRVYTRAQLIDTVWGDGFAITDRTIDSHVKALRRKVSEAGADPGLIETVRGVGYRITDASSGIAR
jgi:two-component system catabolic regulation response regulator CreB